MKTKDIFCRACHFPLRDPEGRKCPACGIEYDPSDPKSYSQPGRIFSPVRVLVWGGIAVVGVLMAYFVLSIQNTSGH